MKKKFTVLIGMTLAELRGDYCQKYQKYSEMDKKGGRSLNPWYHALLLLGVGI